MYLHNLKILSVKKDLNQSRLASLSGVSRAAVTRWFQQVNLDGWVNIETKTLKQLAEGLGVSPDQLLKPDAGLDSLQTRFLWDKLYPNMELFAKALSRNQKQALARLVQIVGFHQAMQIAGKKIIRLFPEYKKFIHPVRCRQLELLWPLYC